MYMSFSDIQQEIKKPLDYKIEEAVKAIAQGLAVSNRRR